MPPCLGRVMLIYHPIYDVNHCVYRTLLILESSIHNDIELDLYRHIDFYLLFPHLLKKIQPFPAELASFRKIIKNMPEPYELMINVKRAIFDLEAIQTTALQNLIAKNIIEFDSYKNKNIRRTQVQLPEAINKMIMGNSIVNEEWFRMLINEFPTINFLGKKGLKARSGLMEFRYDVESA